MWCGTYTVPLFGPGRVRKRYDGCSCSSYMVLLPVSEKMPKALLIRNGKLTKLRIHIRDNIPDRSTVLDFLLDGATFRVRSTFRTCFNNFDKHAFCAINFKKRALTWHVYKYALNFKHYTYIKAVTFQYSCAR